MPEGLSAEHLNGATTPVADDAVRPEAAPSGSQAAMGSRSGMPRWVKVVLSVVVVAGGLGYLLYATASDEMYLYLHVNEAVARASEIEGQRVQVKGKVVPGSLARRAKTNQFEYRFRVESQGQSLEARYVGVVPDTFKEGAGVVLTGTLTPEGIIKVAPGGVMATCPSKYEQQQ